jgi:hypothetical protein
MPLRKTIRYSRHTYGDNGRFGRRNIISTSMASTDIGKRAAASTASILASTAGATTARPVYEPVMPRTVTVTASAGTGTVVVTGVNTEGKLITENFVITNTSTVSGVKAFARIDTIQIPSGVTCTAGLGAAFGIGFRNASTALAKVLVIQANGTAALENAASSTFDANNVENNIFTPTTTPNSVLQFRVYVMNYNWHVDPVNAQPNYGV